MVDFLRIADRSWPVLGRVMGAHAVLYRATRGRLGRRLPGLPPMLLLDHVGARSGTKRTSPLVYMPDGPNFILVAAKGGHPKHPGWVHNLRAHPDTEVQVGSSRVAVHASEANDEERRRLWPRAVAYNPVWERYQRRTQRTVPLVILRPRRQGLESDRQRPNGEEQQMSQENVDLVTGGYDDFNSGNVQGVLARFDAQIEWVEPGGGNAPAGTFNGPDAVGNDVFGSVAENFEEFSCTVEDAADQGDTVVVTARFKGRNKSGAEVDTQAQHTWEVRDGKIVRFEQKLDDPDAWARGWS